ncbi:MAG: hypothetical protein KIIPBIDF_01367 [Candidatus Methanoperedenaceae archaeon GB50]|nr:MAG: hypothetical protein KIIPBIDF_01367 [Candidatus Methanoperedenaceae archaeon GB50]
MVEPVFSPDGKKIAAIVKLDEPVVELKPYRVWSIIVDDYIWPEWFDMVWDPVFSPDGENVATKVERNHKYTWAINGKVWNKEFDAIWPPIFSPDGTKLLLRCIENGKYYRRIIPVSEILG